VGQNKGPEMRKNMQSIKAQEQALVLASDFDEAKAQQLAASMVEQRTTMQVEKMRTQHRMLSVLNEEQKQQLVEMKAERMAKCQQEMEKNN
jgi:protein CpxP